MDRVVRVSGGTVDFNPADTPNVPLVFLGGPASSSHDWRVRAIEVLCALKPDLVVAVPRFLEQNTLHASLAPHVFWRRTHQFWASRCGVIFFWFPRINSDFDPSLLELGEWLATHNYRGVKIVVGIESGFAQEFYIRKRIYDDFRDVPVVSTLEAACRQCVELLSAPPS